MLLTGFARQVVCILLVFITVCHVDCGFGVRFVCLLMLFLGSVGNYQVLEEKSSSWVLDHLCCVYTFCSKNICMS